MLALLDCSSTMVIIRIRAHRARDWLCVDLGRACKEYQNKALRDLPCRRIQCDEIWSFCYSKEKNVPQDLKGLFGYGDVWTWTAMCADTKLVPSFLVANRSAAAATLFIEDLAGRLKHRVQLTTDGLKVDVEAIEGAFGCDVDYAMLIKVYGNAGTTRHKTPHQSVIAPPKSLKPR
jgi:hypothetical protein